MSLLPPELTPHLLLLAIGVTLFAGLIKGMSGFALPMIMISVLPMFLPPELALAALILPTVVSNALQALRLGRATAWANVKRFRFYMLAGMAMLIVSSQLVAVLPVAWLFMMIGAPVMVFAVLMLSGWAPRLRAEARLPAMLIGGFSGFVGGFSGVWGPPTVVYLTAIDLPKRDHVQVQGVIYSLGAVALFFAHVGSGVMRGERLTFSLLMVVPAMAGMLVGQQVMDRIDQQTFRRLTLLVLLVAGANLVRKAVF